MEITEAYRLGELVNLVNKVTWTMVMDAAATIPQTKQLAYRPNSSSSSPVNAIIQRPGACLQRRQRTDSHSKIKKLPVKCFKIKS